VLRLPGRKQLAQGNKHCKFILAEVVFFLDMGLSGVLNTPNNTGIVYYNTGIVETWMISLAGSVKPHHPGIQG
jgi:hypothetical protein